MGMSSRVIGVRDLDLIFSKMIAVKNACELAGINYPKEIIEYFKYPVESEDYLRKQMEEIDITVAVNHKQNICTDYFEVDIAKLPQDVKVIRFENIY